ncbi:hypothetical protein [Ammoniphilus sp. 3BR4]|uniref:hypothetical protein n=1 Tax=Ammoniphilus sp. 3BR4 TaxID=3158265 RepID=UPI00346561D7
MARCFSGDGPWDRFEIEERAVVLAIAIDEEEPEAAKEEKDVAHLGGMVPESQKKNDPADRTDCHTRPNPLRTR